MKIYEVAVTKQAEKQLRTLPAYIVLKLQAWIDFVKHKGLSEVRKIPGFHDEPLKGKRQGQRSIRLNKAYRAIYLIDTSGLVYIAKIVEISKHEY